MRQCDELFPVGDRNTFVIDSNNMRGANEYMLTNCDQFICFNVLNIDINLSDHIPILAICSCDVLPAHSCERVKSAAVSADVILLRWDHVRSPSSHAMSTRGLNCTIA